MINMKKFILVFLVPLLASCIGPGDKGIINEPAHATFRDNQLCVMVPIQDPIYLSTIQFAGSDDSAFRKVLPPYSVMVQKGDCLPNFDFKFNENVNYTLYYSLIEVGTQNIKYYSVGFSLTGQHVLLSPGAK
ncbi:hypothetical protein PUG42_01315 [Erwiniaceae bacterium L1_54_3]|nr:hypothetical protein [Erwiniaceae bacterium L1_54_3]